ncbi:hypothetical protein QG087_10465, partial [Kingella kingae]|uniref:hypothetical protein n=1 Tax=Kingella kingae TaxID=504 RepID=UPI00254A9A26
STTPHERANKMKTLSIITKTGYFPVASFEKGKLAFWRRQANGSIASDIKPILCKNIKEAKAYIAKCYRGNQGEVEVVAS